MRAAKKVGEGRGKSFGRKFLKKKEEKRRKKKKAFKP